MVLSKHAESETGSCSVLQLVVELARFVVPNKEDCSSEQATSVCAFLNQFNKL